MRTLLFSTLVLLSLTTSAQKKTLPDLYTQYSIPQKDGEALYEIIDSSVAGKTKDEIFRAAQSALVQAFKDSKAVLEVNDKEDGHLMGKGNTQYYFNSGLYRANIILPFVIDIRAKDGRYRIQIKDFNQYTLWNEVNGKRSDYDANMSGLPERGKNYQENFLTLMNKRVSAIMLGIQTDINKKLKSDDSF